MGADFAFFRRILAPVRPRIALPFAPFRLDSAAIVLALAVVVAGALTSADRLPAPARFLPYFERHDVQEGLSFNSVTTIYQDHQGFMWIGTDDGINRYDGHSFLVFKPDDNRSDALSAAHVESMAEDKLGRLWIGTNTGGANRFDRNTRRFIHYDMRQTVDGANACWRFLRDRAGDFWAMSPRGLQRYDYKADRFIDPPAANRGILKLLREFDGPAVADSDGTLWISTNDAFAHYDPRLGSLETFERDPNKDASAPHGSMHLLRDEASGLWITGLKGLQRFDIHSHAFTNYYPSGVREDEGNYLYEAIMDDRGRIWSGSMHSGLVEFDTATHAFTLHRADPHNPHALPDNRVGAVYRDRANTIWTGSLGGIALFNEAQQHFAYYHHDPTDPSSLSAGPIREMAEDARGRIWVGSDGDGLNVLDRATGKCLHYRHDPANPASLSENTPIALTIDSQQRVWAGTWGAGLNLLSPGGAFRHFRYKDSSSEVTSDYFWDLFTDRRGVIWATTWGGGLMRIDPRTLVITSYRWNPRDTANSIHSNFVFTIRQGETDTDYWVGTTAGIEHFNPKTGSFRAYFNGPHIATSWMLNNASTVVPASISRHAAGGQNSVWILNYAGLVHFDPVTHRFRLWDRNRGLPINSASALLVAPDSSCWISTRSGLVHAVPFDDTLGLRFRTYNAADGLQSTDFTGLSCLTSRDGHFFFGSVSGLVEFDPGALTDNQDKAPVRLTGFQVFNRPFALDTDLATIQTIPLDYRDNVITFEFAALNYVRPGWNRYAYKLEGFDNEWVYCGNKHEANYTNLDPGTYRFIVRATNNDGVWSDKFVSVALVIAPPFWRTTWFAAVVFCVILLSLYSGYRWRIRTIEARNRQLESQVAARTKEVAAQRDELQKAYEELKQAEVQLVQSEKMASLGQLTAGIAHEINNPINFISGNIEPLKRDLDDLLALLDTYEGLLKADASPEEIEQMRKAVEAKRQEIQLPSLLAEVRMLMNGMQEGATRTSTIVRGLRNFSRLDQNALKEADIEEGIESTIALLASRWRGRITIERLFDPAARQIECYPGELNQVFMNLLSNAIEAIANTGTIRISTERQGDSVRIIVKDSGEGIDPAALPRIFEPFFTTKPVGAGTGLGLSISYGIVQKHHGTIEFETGSASAGRSGGTRAIVTLPVTQSPGTRQPVATNELNALSLPRS